VNNLGGPVDGLAFPREPQPTPLIHRKSTYSQLKRRKLRAYWVRSAKCDTTGGVTCRALRTPEEYRCIMSPESKLLLVEDDLLLARALARLLRARGVHVRHAARCATASGLTGPFPVGVFDIDLPDGDGIELARRLRSLGVVERVVFYTACSEPQRLARARELGNVFVKSAQLPSLLELSPRAVEADARPGRVASAQS
jgi:CheY-like chemotaxis protein